MDVTPQLLHDVEFREAKRNGYNTQDVDEFLERLAVGLERQEGLLRDLRQRAESADARVAEAERRASEAVARASEASDTDETLKRTLVLAQRTADAAIKEAEEQAARTLSAAQEQATRMLADAQETAARAKADAEGEARRAQEEARARVLAELRDLEAARDQLQSDVGALERHLDDQRDRVRLAQRELQRILDDPSALRAAEAPVIAEVSVPATPVAEEPLVAAAPEPEPEPAQEPAPAPEPEIEPVAAAEEPSAWTPDDAAWGEAPAPASSSVFAEVDVRESPDAGPGPDTQPVDMLAERDADDDAYLAELRKAMTDDSPLGPREDADDLGLFGSSESGRSRFGRRR